MADRFQRPISRRRFVRGTASLSAGLFGLAIAGCSSSNNNGNTKKASTVAPAASQAAAATTVAATRAATAAAGASAAASAAASPAAARSPAASTLKLPGDVGFGFISSFTGPLATVYQEFVAGAKLAIDEINGSGGVGGVKFTLEQADDQSNPAQVPAAALGVVDKKLHFCIGPIGSNAISASPALNQAKIIQCGYSDNPQLADASKFPYSFRFVWSAEQSSKLLIDYFTKQLKFTKIAILAENTVYGQTDAPTTSKYMDSLSLKPTVNEYFQSGTADFTPLLRKVQDAGSQAIVWWTQGGPEAITVLKNMNDIKLDLPIAGIGFAGGLVKGVVPDALLDKTLSVAWKRLTYSDSEPISQKVKDWNKRLGDAGGLGKIGSGGTSPFYDFVYYMKAAIEATGGTDSTAIVKYMEATPYDGLVANFDGITAKDHTIVKDGAISLGTLSSWNAADKVFLKRPAGL
ncbi:MAG TPA: ABC transporter substrate-binding protein [Dehalococcoidia bacterium]|nr:ABC transporter substrate-binding protein [Dehalococcoidia bacterium]